MQKILDEQAPQIIIGGMPRSGTSLLRAIIGSHSQIALYKWELPFWTQFYPKFKNNALHGGTLDLFLDELFQNYTIKKSDIPFDKVKFKQELLANKQEITAVVIYRYLLEYYRKGRKKSFVGIKTPYNELYTSEILKHFPNAKIIQLVRNPLEAMESHKKAQEKWWGGRLKYFKHIYDWKRSVQCGLYYKEKHPDNFYLLKFEDLVNQPMEYTKRICDFLNITFTPELLEMKGQPGWKGNNSSFDSSIREAGSEKTVLYYNGLLAHQMRKLGYKVSNHNSRLLTIRFHTWSFYHTTMENVKMSIKRILCYTPFRF